MHVDSEACLLVVLGLEFFLSLFFFFFLYLGGFWLQTYLSADSKACVVVVFCLFFFVCFVFVLYFGRIRVATVYSVQTVKRACS